MQNRLDMLRTYLKSNSFRALLKRLAIIVVCVGVLCGLVYLAFLRFAPELLPLLKSGNEDAIAAYLGSQNTFTGILSTAILAFIQPVSIVLPGAPIQIAAGIVYGTLKGFLLCHCAYVLANVAVFYLARVLRERLEQYVRPFSSKLNFLQNAQYPVYMTAMACLIPLVPNGIVPYAAARTHMKLHEFLLAVVLGSFFPVLIMCAIGKQILHGEYLYAAVLFGFDLAVVVVLTRFRAQVCQWLHTVGEHFSELLHRADP